MYYSFPNIRICLLAGIGGEAPIGEDDIRLGDVVVSHLRPEYGGVYAYDIGMIVQDRNGRERFEPKGLLNRPPSY